MVATTIKRDDLITLLPIRTIYDVAGANPPANFYLKGEKYEFSNSN